MLYLFYSQGVCIFWCKNSILKNNFHLGITMILCLYRLILLKKQLFLCAFKGNQEWLKSFTEILSPIFCMVSIVPPILGRKVGGWHIFFPLEQLIEWPHSIQNWKRNSLMPLSRWKLFFVLFCAGFFLLLLLPSSSSSYYTRLKS